MSDVRTYPRLTFQDAGLTACKWLGLFWLARMITRRSVRILCYHGFAVADEISFRPSLYITASTFAQRLEWLVRSGYKVITLDEAVKALARSDVPRDATVLTVDDVFDSFVSEAWPLLRRHKLPVTLYVTSYYSIKEEPVFRLVVRYAFWKTTQESLDLGRLDSRMTGGGRLSDAAVRADLEEQVVAFGEALPGEGERQALLARVLEALQIDQKEIWAKRVFHVVTKAQINKLIAEGADVQLHTHRHRLTEAAGQIDREIVDNRQAMQDAVRSPMRHLCYPSGVWSETMWPALQRAGIESATTCEIGLNNANTPPLALKRILDAEDVSQIRFEAEVTGFKPLLRRFFAPWRGHDRTRINTGQ